LTRYVWVPVHGDKQNTKPDQRRYGLMDDEITMY
jgi:hypothetical protein